MELSSARHQQQYNQRDMTTVRIRTKANQYIYSQASYGKPLFHVINEAVRQNAYGEMEKSPERQIKKQTI